MKKTATFTGTEYHADTPSGAHWRHYLLDPPMTYTEYNVEGQPYERSAAYVIVSAADVPLSGPETYIFPATAKGEIDDFGELEGSYRGGLDHRLALENAGYEVDGDD